MAYDRSYKSAAGKPRGVFANSGASSGSARNAEEAARACAAAFGAHKAAGANAASRNGGASTRESASRALSVSAAMQLAKGALEGVTVRLVGEISELSNKPGYKAVYFTVKDESASLPCMMWNNRFRAAGVQVTVGQLVELTGRFTLYAAKGRMNFDVFSLAPVGEGQLRLQVANLARKLSAEGLADPARKLPLPAYPLTLGLVTSPRGDAVHDVLRTLRRRFPVARVLFSGVAVEGPQAPAGIVEGMRAVVHAGAEVVLVVRGGGSYEDLMPFNDEFLARMIVKCPVPVVTGIGHEPDTSIADMVADVRASTPTAAAEAVSPARENLDALFGARRGSLDTCVRRVIEGSAAQVGRIASRPVFCDPNALLAPSAQGVDLYADRLSRALPASLDRDRAQVDRLRERLGSALPNALTLDAAAVQRQRERLTHALSQVVDAPTAQTQRARERLMRVMPQACERARVSLDHEQRRLLASGCQLLEPFRRQAGLSAAQLDALSPLAVLGRGYSIARDGDGGVVKSIEQAQAGQKLDVTVSDGVIECSVSGVRRAGADDIA